MMEQEQEEEKRITAPKLKKSTAIAVALFLVIAIWFAINNVGQPDKPAPVKTVTERAIPSVSVERIYAQPHENTLKLHGRTEAAREVSVKAETAGLVVRAPIKEGTFVKTGTLLCQQDIDARGAMLDQAKAALRSRELDYTAAQTLVDKGYRSSTQAAAALAALDGARASVKQAEIELSNVEMRAPFSGRFEQQMAEIGEYLSPGQPCGLLVDLDPLLIVGSATESQIGGLKVGDLASAALATGEAVEGKIRFIQSSANPATRTFRIEVAVPNADLSLKAGVTSTIKLIRGAVDAHLIPSSVLALNDEGAVGVRHVGYDGRVIFSAVETIDDTPEGLWVTGLPERAEVIVLGQDYVSAGTKVQTQFSTHDLNASSDTPFGGN